jgi:hypothetical protein
MDLMQAPTESQLLFLLRWRQADCIYTHRGCSDSTSSSTLLITGLLRRGSSKPVERVIDPAQTNVFSMEQPRGPLAVATPPVRMALQPIEDFDAEMDALDALKPRTAPANQIPTAPQHLPKKAKKTIDVAAIEVEKVAREELGNENWIGKLVGSLIL